MRILWAEKPELCVGKQKTRRFEGIIASMCWGTRTRTRKDRTRICSVANYTIPQTGIIEMPSRRRCKITHSLWNDQINRRFFRAKSHFVGRMLSSVRAARIHTRRVPCETPPFRQLAHHSRWRERYATFISCTPLHEQRARRCAQPTATHLLWSSILFDRP